MSDEERNRGFVVDHLHHHHHEDQPPPPPQPQSSEKNRGFVVDHQHHRHHEDHPPPPPQPQSSEKNRGFVVDHQHHRHHEDRPPPPPQPQSSEKNRGFVVDHQHHRHHEDHPPPPPQPQYGTFQGVSNYPPPSQHPVIGFPQPVPPPGVTAEPYAHGYQTVPGYAIAEGRPVTQRRLPCCGCGVGWFLFIIGFFLGAIPWYVGLFILACARIDPREKPGYVACTIAAILATVAIILGVTKGADDW